MTQPNTQANNESNSGKSRQQMSDAQLLQGIYELQSYATKFLQLQLQGFSSRRRQAHPTRANVTEANRGGRDPFAGLSEKTIAAYRRCSNALLEQAKAEGEDVWATLQRRRPTKNSYRTGRASLQACAMHDAIVAQKHIDLQTRRIRADLSTAEERRDLADFIASLTRNLQVLETMPQAMPADLAKGGQHSKSRSGRGLPVNWPELVAAKLKPATAVQLLVEASTGCRPEEIALGVTVEVSEDQRELTFEIKGAKTGEFSGQKWRRFSVPSLDGPARMLVERLEHPGVHTITLDVSPAAYSKRVWRVSKQLWPNRSPATVPTPYSTRHRMKASLRAAGVSREETAMVLGHSTTDSQTYYGGRGGSSSRVAPSKIAASRKVKVKAGYQPQATVPKATGATKPSASPVAKARRRPKP